MISVLWSSFRIMDWGCYSTPASDQIYILNEGWSTTGCPCGVWNRGLTTCLLYGPFLMVYRFRLHCTTIPVELDDKEIPLQTSQYHHRNLTFVMHDDVIKWKHFPRYWLFVRGIRRWPVDSPPQRPVTRRFDVFFDQRLNKRFSKQARHRCFETQSRSLWCHCNG